MNLSVALVSHLPPKYKNTFPVYLSTTVGFLAGAAIGFIFAPPLMDVWSPMHPLEKMFYPLRDPFMAFSGAVCCGSAGAIIANKIAKRIFN